MEMRNFVLLVLVTVAAAVPLEKQYQNSPVKPMTIKAACDDLRPQNITGESGQFSSPNYPQNYPDNSECEWILSSNLPNGRVMLDFSNFSLAGNCPNDCVYVFDGTSEAAPLLATIGGQHNAPGTPSTIFSTQPSLFVDFVSDAATANTGFQAKFSREIACHIYGPQVIAWANGLDSPYYPYSYANNLTCRWVTPNTGPGVYYVTRFTEFNVGVRAADGTCSEAWLDVPRSSGTQRLCGMNAGLGVAIPAKNDYFNFHSDASTIPATNQRFHANFEGFNAVAGVSACGPAQPDMVSSYSGVVSSANYPGLYPDSARCTYEIMSSEPNGSLTMDFNAFNTEATFDFVTVYDGDNEGAPVLAILDGVYTQANLPPTIHSMRGAYLFIKFTSDASITRNGYQAKYTSDIACGPRRPRHAHECIGNITSPYHPQYWGNNMNCTWHIVVPAGNTLHLRFHEFNLGTRNADQTCGRARLHVTEADTVVATHCGNTIPAEWTSTAPYVTLNLDTDNPTAAPTGERYIVEYELVGAACPLNGKQ